MPVDASIYSNVKPLDANTNIPSPMTAMEGALRLSTLGIQHAQMARQMQTQAAVQNAYVKNTDEGGNLNRTGFLSDLGKLSPMAADQYHQNFVEQDKQQAEMQEKQAQAKAAQMDTIQKTVGVTMPAMDYLAGLREDQRATAYPNVIKQLKDQGVDTSKMPEQYDSGHFMQTYAIGQKMKPYLENQLTQAQIEKTQAETVLIPQMKSAELNSNLYGSRSPNAELTSQYDKQATPIRSSQMAMSQMIDNYKNPSPQGDASLVLNAYKIKFPNAPDVNSLKELSESQAAPDAFKNMAHKVFAGGLDQPTRDNLMRDGVSTFRANVTSLRGIQERFQARAKQQNVSDPTLTAEPAIDRTFADSESLQKQIGPYVPPPQRGGVTGALYGAASKLLGTGGNKSANASAKPAAPKPGAVEDGFIFNGGDASDQKNWKRVK